MIGQERAEEILEQALRDARGDQAEALLVGYRRGLTRFAGNRIHQNMAEKNTTLTVRVVIAGRLGVASTNRLERRQVREVAYQAATMARLQGEDREFHSLPAPRDIPAITTFVPATAEATPRHRARGVAEAVEVARTCGFDAAGACSTMVEEVGVANSLGVRAYGTATLAFFHVVVMSREGASGYARAVSRDIREIDPQALAEKAAGKCRASAGAIELPPGEYEAVLEPPAVAQLVEFLGYLGGGALALQEGRSFMAGRLGRRVTGEEISMWDDGLDPRGLAFPFDFEGVPKERVMIIERGIARGVVYDSYTAGREGKASTGHALPPPNRYGPMPTHLFLGTGKASLEEMIRSTRRGLLVSRFHYVNPVHPLKTIITGMTRDGTFLVENGEIACPVRNLRFTQSILEALGGVEMIGREASQQGSDGTSTVVPPLKLKTFRFSGVTPVLR